MEIVATTDAPAAIGPYSQAVKANGFVYCSGQIPLKADGTFVNGGIAEQTDQVLNNLKVVLQAAGSEINKVVKTTVFLTNMVDFAAMNEVYGKYFADNKPARATVQVAGLPKSALVEIECVATL